MEQDFPSSNRQTQIIATIGPASEQEVTISQMITAGVDIFRFSYGRDTLVENRKRIGTLNKVSAKSNQPVIKMMDVPGRKNRIISKKSIWVKPGDRFLLEWSANRDKESSSEIQLLFHIPIDKQKPGDTIFFGDGDFSAHFVSRSGKDSILIEFDNYGEVAPGRGVTFCHKSIETKKALSPRDRYFIKQHISLGFDQLALSFVNSADDLIELRNYLKNYTDKIPALIAKIETEMALKNLDEILLLSDGVMIARGDLGLNIPFEQIPFIQKQILIKANSLRKYVIVATQMLESISDRHVPYRSDITDIATAVYQGASALMLSGETRTGKNPIHAVKTMDKIIRQAEIDKHNEIALCT